MKAKKFKRVVEWERKPNDVVFCVGIISIILAVLGIIFAILIYLEAHVKNSLNEHSLENGLVFLVANSILVLAFGIQAIIYAKGEKKEYFVEVKDVAK